MIAVLERYSQDESGATAIEYGLLAALIGVAIVSGATTFSTATSETYNYLGSSVESGMSRVNGG